MDNHPLFKIDESQFSKEFNLGVVLAKVALGVVSALVVRAALAKIDSFTAKRRKLMATYTVQSGDTLGTIAKKFLGDSQRYKEIAAVNPQITDLNLIQVGQTINIPDTNTATTIPPKPASSFSFPSLIPSASASESSPSTSDGSGFFDKIKELAQNKKVLIGIGLGLVAILYYQSRQAKK